MKWATSKQLLRTWDVWVRFCEPQTCKAIACTEMFQKSASLAEFNRRGRNLLLLKVSKRWPQIARPKKTSILDFCQESSKLRPPSMLSLRTIKRRHPRRPNLGYVFSQSENLSSNCSNALGYQQTCFAPLHHQVVPPTFPCLRVSEMLSALLWNYSPPNVDTNPSNEKLLRNNQLHCTTLVHSRTSNPERLQAAK